MGMQAVSEAVAMALKAMIEYAQEGMTTQELDEYGGKILKQFGAKSAPFETYGFPGFTCISVNEECAHGVPNVHTILKQGDLVNIDVSAELNGFWSDNGSSFVLGEDTKNHFGLVNTSKRILKTVLNKIRHGVPISDVGHLIETEAKKSGYLVIRNLAGHGVGRKLHEPPENILNYRDRWNREQFHRNTTVAIETFISTRSDHAIAKKDGWTLVGNNGGYIAQHEHTIMVTDDIPLILTAQNDILI